MRRGYHLKMAPNTIDLGATGRQVVSNVSRLRKQLRLSYAQLSLLLDKTERPIRATGLHRLENGKRRVDVDDLVALATALGVEPIALLEQPSVSCAQCADEPPVGFTCQRCGRSGRKAGPSEPPD